MGADAREDVAEVGERVDAQVLTCGSETGQDRRGPSTVVTAVERQFFRPTGMSRGLCSAPLLSIVAVQQKSDTGGLFVKT